MKRNMGYLKSVQSKWELRFIVCICTMRTETLINKYCMPRKMLRTPKCIFFNPYKSFVCELQLCLRELRWPSQVLTGVRMCMRAQSCPTFCDSTDCSPPGAFVHGIFQARILVWVAISFSRGSSQPRDRTWVSCTAGRFFTDWATREAPFIIFQ